ncbi:MAG: TolC family protein [Candidatus Zapsychrus exili]|nr:TolC family protein [Candidatus Zapsychrus exili]
MLKNKKNIFIIILLILIISAPAFSYEKKDAVSLGEDSQAVYYVSLDEVSKLALDNNFDIQLSKYDAWIAQTDKGVSESIYDVMFDAEAKYANDQSKPASATAATEVVDNDYNVGLSKKLPTGTTVDIDMTNNRQWTDSSSASSALSHESDLGLTISQELGKNFFGIQDRGDVKVRAIDIENAEYTSLEKIETNLSEVQASYWDLALQIERVRIKEDMVSQAKKLYDLHAEKFKDGLVEKPELIASEANYKKRSNELILAQNQIKSKENALKLLLNISDDNIHIEPTEKLDIVLKEHDLESSMKDAFESRRNYKKALNDIKSKDIKLSMKKNNLWPEINLTATMSRNRLGDHFKSSSEDLTDEDNPYFYAGLKVSFPIGNTDAKSKMKAAELNKAKSVLNLKYIERKIAVDIIDSVRNCDVYKETASNSEQIALLQAEKLKEEEKRYNQGRSDTDTLIRFQEDLILAEELLSTEKHRYKTSLITLELKQGTLLKKYWEEEL